MFVHTISHTDYADFLAQQREDPVTGDRIQAGDEVVFCTECKSAFLLDSWQYLGEQHCGQRNTMDSLPKSNAISLKKTAYLGYYVYLSPMITYEVERSKPQFQRIWEGLQKFLGFVFVFAFIFLAVFSQKIIVMIMVLSGILSAIMEGFLRIYNPKKEEPIEVKKLIIRKYGVQIADTEGKYQSYPFKKIASLHLRLDQGYGNFDKTFSSATVNLCVNLKSGKSIWVGITNNNADFHDVSQAIFELHNQVYISFAVNDKREYTRLKEMVAQAELSVEVVRI
ncbi:MAG: hypothetical protein AAF740_10040 [Bacteroidota bacterium]